MNKNLNIDFERLSQVLETSQQILCSDTIIVALQLSH
jgi:hypothetical protein